MSFWAANVGTETSGSILSPSNQNMLGGIKPTVGRVSRYGVIPITADQDTPGPMARTVADAAIMLGAMEGATPDPNDPATSTCTPPPTARLHAFLRRDGLKGARIGIPRAFYLRRSRHAWRARIDRRRAERRAEARDDRGHRRHARAGRDGDRSGGHSVDRHHRSRLEAFVGPGSGPEDAKGRDEDCSRRVQIRHEARLQRLARVARRSRAGEIADRAARMESRAPVGRHAEVRAGAAGQLGRNGPHRRPRALRSRPRQGPRSCRATKASTRR